MTAEVNSPAVGVPLHGPVGRLEPERAASKAESQAGNARQTTGRCEYCNDTGDVTSIDGEWRGYCACDEGKALKAWGKPPCQQCGAMTADEALSRCMGPRTEDGCHGNDLWPD